MRSGAPGFGGGAAAEPWHCSQPYTGGRVIPDRTRKRGPDHSSAAQGLTDKQVVATVAPTALTGIAKIQQNGVWSNAVGFTVPVGGGNTLVPALLNLVVGDTRTLQALNASGQTVTGLTWTSSNRTVVSLSTDDPPLLTALAVGNVTITAGTAAADVTVSAATLPLGTVIWSNPGDGSGAQSILPAVPSTTGVADVFAFQADGTVQAIAADGTTAWTADISQAQAFAGGTYDMSQGTLLPDFQGGLVVMNNDGSIYKLDGITGQAYPAYTLPGPGCSVYCELPTGGLAVHPDGTIFTTYTDENGYNVIGIDPTTGTQKFMVPATFNGVEPFQGGSTTIIVAGDGYAYYSYPYLDSVYEYPATCRLGVLRVSSSGDAQSIPVFSATCGGWAGGIGYTYLTGANMITNADQGILLTWQTPNPDGSGYTSRMATVTGGAAAMAMEPAVPSEAGSAVVPVLQAQDGSFVGTFWDSSGDYDDMVAFDAAGIVRWIVPNETPQIATADGGVIGQSGITYDQYGNATGQIPNMPTQSWIGNAYQDDPGQTQQLISTPKTVATSSWPGGGNGQSPPGANASGTPTAAQTAQVKLHVSKLNYTASIDLAGIVRAAQDIWAKQSNGAIALLWDHSIQNVSPCAIPGCIRYQDLSDLLDVTPLDQSNIINYWIQAGYFLQMFPDRKGINVVQIATLPPSAGNDKGLTLNMPLAQSGKFDPTTLSNIIVLPNNTGKVLGHEVGHALLLEHVSDPSNLMCGAPPNANWAMAIIDSYWCFEWATVNLNADQLKTARAKALALVEP